MSKVLVLGVGGQDGSYLAELLLEKGHEVHGLVRRSSVDNIDRIRSCRDRVTLYRGDIAAGEDSLRRVIDSVRPEAIYNLADQDVVSWSYDTPSQSVDVTYGGASRLLEVVARVDRSIRVFQPCSATVFGSGHNHPCDEDTPFAPDSPYAVAKAAAYHLARMHRRRGLFVSTAILYGHNSVRQKPEYLLHRLAKEAVEVAAGRREFVEVTDPGFRVDVGCAREYVRGMYDLMQLGSPDDFVMCTERTFSVGALARTATFEAGCQRTDVRETVRDEVANRAIMTGDCFKAHSAFGWNPKRDAMDVLADLVEHYHQLEREREDS